jgi:hypothetical protein
VEGNSSAGFGGAAADGGGTGVEGNGGAVVQPASVPRSVPKSGPGSAPRIAATAHPRRPRPRTTNETENAAMWLILLEALGAGATLVFIVWWTMFAGRRRGEPPTDKRPGQEPE